MGSSAGLFDYDAELARYTEPLRAAFAVGPGDRVLDIGCGTGQTTRDAARVAASAVGVDVSERMLKVARRRAAEEGLRNIAFELADAQTHPFPPAHFDLAISRFGTMFFADPVAAFTNIARALRPGARLVMLVWQSADRQEWSTAVRQALAPGRELPAAAGPGAFSLADPAVVAKILSAAGFSDVDFTDVHEPVYYGPDPGAACEQVLVLASARDLLAGLDPASTERALDRLRATLAAHATDDGVWFDAHACIVTAHRRPH
ncbi:MAG TPA: methyltransferase domain-containing protein [Actinophytocola sp.]|uniref:class I SAM-dependent methyltransferase n=1 Tax=Actinophytocola sp. TaxID=1872138 RepID=UPI002DDDAECE|nr:methyltransferase domain-containing protein [Actinophytocola sp.]HEV2779693.1 methyltransferase domain-containing protein [Actinophytocola sp.]